MPSTTLRIGTVAVVLSLSTVSLGACSAVYGGTCEGTAAELKRLSAQSLLASAPAGAEAPANYRGVGVTTGCDDDSSGEPWLHADRVYVFPDRPDVVLAHYSKAATAAGWHHEPDPDPEAPPATSEGACWTKTSQGRHLLLGVNFGIAGSYSPEPEAGTGIVYEVSVGTTPDGGADGTACWE